MGRKNKHALIEHKNKAKVNKVKKDKNAFKVTSQNKIKKAKPVQNSVKKIVKKETPKKGKAGEALNAKFNNLHKDMVVSKPKVQTPRPAVKAKPKGKAPKAAEVADVLASMDV